MYSQVPPPHELCGVPSTSTQQSEHVPDYSKPDNVSDFHWKKFQELKARRERECGKATEKRKAAIKYKTLKAVTKELSSADRAILEDDGVSLPSRYQRKKRKCDLPTDSGVEVTGRGETSAAAAHTVSGTHSEQWEEMKQYFDPNPQLKGAEQGRYGVKSRLEERMDLAIEQGQFDEAVMMSEKLSQREFASKLATAFDCQEFVKRQKLEEEKRRARKQKLKWRFEHKQRWEMKGNM